MIVTQINLVFLVLLTVESVSNTCFMRKSLLLIFFLASNAMAFAQNDCTELFFSEYIEGSGNSKGLEIYNPTGSIIDLSKYYVARYSNGSANYAAGGITQLEGFLPSHEVFVFVNGQTSDVDLGGGNISPKCDPALQALADKLDGAYPSPTYMNGNDVIALLKVTDGNLDNAIAVDLIGEIGLGAAIKSELGWSYVKDSTLTYRYDSTQTDLTTQGQVINYIVQALDVNGENFGPYWMSWTKDHTLIRKPSVKSGVTSNPSPFVVTMEWDTASSEKDVWDSLGFHDCECNSITSIEQNIEVPAEVSIYPNPSFNGQFQVSANLPIQELEVLNLVGQTIFRQDFNGHTSFYTVRLPEANKGIYLVCIRFPDHTQTVKKVWLK